MEQPATAVNPGWRKSSHSDNGAGSCVEVASTPNAVLIRDTTDHGQGLTLRVTPAAWWHLTTRIRDNRALS